MYDIKAINTKFEELMVLTTRELIVRAGPKYAQPESVQRGRYKHYHAKNDVIKYLLTQEFGEEATKAYFQLRRR